MGFLSGILDGLGITGNSQGQGFGSGLFNSFLSMANAGLDSLGLSQHGRDQYFAREMQREFLERQIAAQVEENQKNRDFSKEMLDLNWAKTLQNYPELMKISSDNQFNLWRNQFLEQKSYNEEVNSPAGQVHRMMGAGLQPSQGVQSQVQSSFGGTGISAPPNIQGSPLGGSVSPIGLPQGLSSRGSELSQIGSFLRDVAEAKKADKESNRYDEITDAYIEKLYNDALSSYALASYNGVKTVLQRALGKEYMSSEIVRNLRQAMVYGAQEKTEKALSNLYQVEAWLTNSKNEVILEQLPYISEEIQSLINYYKTGSKRNMSEVTLNYATADLRSKQAETEKYIKESADWKSKMDRLDYIFKDETQVERLQSYVENARQAGLIADQMAADLEYFIQNRDVRSTREVLGLMVDAAEGYSKVGHVANGAEFNRQYSIRNSNEAGYIDWKKEHSGDTHETYEETMVNSRGHRVRRTFSRQRAPQSSE